MERHRLSAARQSAVPDGGEARWLRDVLRCNVFDGRYPDGVLPSDGELMRIYGARRAVVREALALLRDEGIVVRLQGVGTHAVRERHVTAFSDVHGVSDELGGVLAVQDRPTVLVDEVLPAPGPVASRLGVEPGDPVLCVEYVATVDGIEVGMATNYLAFPEADAVVDVPFRSDFYSLLRDAGLEVGGSEWVLSAVNADAHVAGHLDVPPGTAVILGEETIWDGEGRVYDVAFCYSRTDRFVNSSTQWAVGARGDRPIMTAASLRHGDDPREPRRAPSAGRADPRSAWTDG